MNEMILFGGKMIRINPKDAKKLEYSNNQGKSWQTLFSGGSPGEFKGLMDGGSELLAQTSKGLFYSKNDGKSWQKTLLRSTFLRSRLRGFVREKLNSF